MEVDQALFISYLGGWYLIIHLPAKFWRDKPEYQPEIWAVDRGEIIPFLAGRKGSRGTNVSTEDPRFVAVTFLFIDTNIYI